MFEERIDMFTVVTFLNIPAKNLFYFLVVTLLFADFGFSSFFQGLSGVEASGFYIAKRRRVSRKGEKRKFKRRKGFLCPRDMVLVYSKKQRVKVCVDKFEFSVRPSGTPLSRVKPVGYQSLWSCMRLCRKRGKRILNHREWLIACEGTKPRYCNKWRTHPLIRKGGSRKRWVYRGVNCKKGGKRWSKLCMNDPSINMLKKGLTTNMGFSKCVSKYGVYNMIGNLGEWVAGIRVGRRGEKLGRFNGGLYPQRKSSCKYTTVSHGPNYHDYSTGCRCGKDPY